MNRLDIKDPEFFDKWRHLYHDLSNEEQIEIANELEVKYPMQKHFSLKLLDAIHPYLDYSSSILEIGGWKGELALRYFAISNPTFGKWHNIDICRNAADNPVSMPLGINTPYFVSIPDRFDWFVNWPRSDYDICISAHTIEHLSDNHLRSLLKFISGIPIVIFEAPIDKNENDWRGYQGTHILKMGWNGVNSEMAKLGYGHKKINDSIYLYSL